MREAAGEREHRRSLSHASLPSLILTGKTTLAAALLASVDPAAASTLATPRVTLVGDDARAAWAAFAAHPAGWQAAATALDPATCTIISLRVQDTPGWDPSAGPDAQGIAALVRSAYTDALASDLEPGGGGGGGGGGSGGGGGGTPSTPSPLFSAALLLLPPHRPPTAGERALVAALEGSTGVPVIPVLAKADAYTATELVGARAAVAGVLGGGGKRAAVAATPFSEASLATAHAPRGAPPFAVCSGCWTGGAFDPTRTTPATPAGAAASSDLASLATLIVDAPDLPTAARGRYAAFRAASLAGGGGGGTVKSHRLQAVPEIEAAEGGPVPPPALARPHRSGREWAAVGFGLALAALAGFALASPAVHARARSVGRRAKGKVWRAAAKGEAATHEAAARVAEGAESAAGSVLERLVAAKARAAGEAERQRAAAAAARGMEEEDLKKKKKGRNYLFFGF